MVSGKPFEVDKEIYDRAKTRFHEANPDKPERDFYYVLTEDEDKLFSRAITCGYGLYNCQVHEENGKYICTWMRGSSCD